MALAVSALKEQIEKAKESLKSVDENIKKITGRDPNEPRPNIDGRRLSGGGPRGREYGSIQRRRSRDTQDQEKESEPPKKRVAVFSRLGAPGGGRRVVFSGRESSKQELEEDEEDEEEETTKPAVQSSVVSTAKKITRSELISAQNVGEKGKARNRRMFGMLLGTLARFQSDSGGQGQQTKQAKKQKEVETRLEEETQEERRKLASQRKTLFNERRAQQRRIQILEQKVALADELVEWEKEWDKKSNFIMTKATPAIFFMPTDFTPRTQRALKDSKERIKDIIEKHKKSVEETMNAYDEEIKFLEERKENQDGKGDSDRKNGDGSNVTKRNKRGVVAEPEEEMDLDSMEPQVEIKVEMDEGDNTELTNEGDGVRNGSSQLPDVEMKSEQPSDDQNRDSGMEEELEPDIEEDRNASEVGSDVRMVVKNVNPSADDECADSEENQHEMVGDIDQTSIAEVAGHPTSSETIGEQNRKPSHMVAVDRDEDIADDNVTPDEQDGANEQQASRSNKTKTEQREPEEEKSEHDIVSMKQTTAETMSEHESPYPSNETHQKEVTSSDKDDGEKENKTHGGTSSESDDDGRNVVEGKGVKETKHTPAHKQDSSEAGSDIDEGDEAGLENQGKKDPPTSSSRKREDEKKFKKTEVKRGRKKSTKDSSSEDESKKKEVTQKRSSASKGRRRSESSQSDSSDDDSSTSSDEEVQKKPSKSRSSGRSTKPHSRDKTTKRSSSGRRRSRSKSRDRRSHDRGRRRR